MTYDDVWFVLTVIFVFGLPAGSLLFADWLVKKRHPLKYKKDDK